MPKGHLEEPCFHHLLEGHEVEPSALQGACCSTVLRMGKQHLDLMLLVLILFLTLVSCKCCSSSLSNFWNTADEGWKSDIYLYPKLTNLSLKAVNSFTDRKCDFWILCPPTHYLAIGDTAIIITELLSKSLIYISREQTCPCPLSISGCIKIELYLWRKSL